MRTLIMTGLPEDAKQIRLEVFVDEQGFENEFDDIDERAFHVVVYEEGKAVSTCRFFYDEERKIYVIGRIAVKKEYRGYNYGAVTVREAEKAIREQGGFAIGLSAQERVVEFYKKLGYIPTEHTYMDEKCPHRWMEKKL